MAVLKIDYDNKDFAWIGKLRTMFPELNSRALGYVGQNAATILKKQILSGQVMDYGGNWFDKSGRRKVSYNVKWNSRVTIASYPTNFFTKGRVFKKIDRATESPVRVFEPLKQKLDSKMQTIMSSFDKKYLQKEIEKAENKGY